MIDDKEFLQFRDGLYKPYFEKYIEYKHGLGEKVTHATLIRLKSLNALLNQCNSLGITPHMIEKVLAPEGKTNHTRREMVSQLRQFSDFMNTISIPCSPVPKKYAKFERSEFRPYIFSQDEIDRILYETDHLPNGIRSNNHKEVYPILIRILIGTGMRIGEVLHLKNQDVDIENGVIKAINGKNGVSRYIPMSDSLLVIIKSYALKQKNRSSETSFFVSPYINDKYSYSAMKYMFQKICTAANVKTVDGKLPNLHSLRHTFCTRSLEHMLNSGISEYTAIPILAAYMGHINLMDTEKYIHFTSIDYDRFIASEEYMKNIVPEVNYDE